MTSFQLSKSQNALEGRNKIYEAAGLPEAARNHTTAEMTSQDVWQKEVERTPAEVSMTPAKQRSRSPVAICARTFRTLYILSALLYTLWHLVTTQIPWISDSASSSSASPSALSDAFSETGHARPHAEEAAVLAWSEWGRLHGVEWDKDVISWDKPPASLPEQSLRQFNTTEDLFLSKAFGESLQPSKVIPYYYRATNNVPKQDITITTLVTSDRFQVLAALVKRYQGKFWFSAAGSTSCSDLIPRSLQVQSLSPYTSAIMLQPVRNSWSRYMSYTLPRLTCLLSWMYTWSLTVSTDNSTCGVT